MSAERAPGRHRQIKRAAAGADPVGMPDFLRAWVYPVLLVCIIGGLWLLAHSMAQLDRAQQRGFPPISSPKIQFNQDAAID